MSNLSDEIEIKNSEILPDNMIYEIFETQYNDLFCKILKITEKSFTYFYEVYRMITLKFSLKKTEHKANERNILE